MVLLKPVYRVAGARSRRPQSEPNQPWSQWQAEEVFVLVSETQTPFRLQSSSVVHAWALTIVKAHTMSGRSCQSCMVISQNVNSMHYVSSRVSVPSPSWCCAEKNTSLAKWTCMEQDTPKAPSRSRGNFSTPISFLNRTAYMHPAWPCARTLISHQN